MTLQTNFDKAVLKKLLCDIIYQSFWGLSHFDKTVVTADILFLLLMEYF